MATELRVYTYAVLKEVETNSIEELRALILERVTRATMGFMYREDYCLLSSHCYLQSTCIQGFSKRLARMFFL